jgi:predicted membrane protein
MNNFLSVVNYCLYGLYGFTFLDVINKISNGDFYLSNATNFVQFLLTLIGVFYAYYRLKTYIRDSRTRSKILEQELIQKENENFYKKWNKDFKL